MNGKVTDTGLSHGVVPPPPVTVIAPEAVNPPSAVVAVMVALPAATPDTTPLLFTVAMLVLPELQLTVLFVALPGDTVAVIVAV